MTPDGPNSPVDQLVALLDDERTRTILTILDDGEPMDVAELASQLVDHEMALMDPAEYEEAVERVLISLGHNHLPKLARAGLIEYDRDERVVTVRSDEDDELRDVGAIDEQLIRLLSDRRSETSAIGVIEDRPGVIEHGRHLIDIARDELFFMYSSDELIEPDCLPHVEAALDRGVEISMGTQDPIVREFTRTHFPDITIWEPQLDWLNTPSYPKIGRFIFVDRRQVMLAIVDEPGADGTLTERAMTGRGESNPLVVLVRELLGARLDHLDYQSDDFLDELPFEP